MKIDLNRNAEDVINILPTVSMIYKSNEFTKEELNIGNDILMPKVLNISPNIDMSKLTHTNIVNSNELQSLLSMSSVLPTEVDCSMLIIPSDASDKSFLFNGKYVQDTSQYFNTMVMSWLHNRIFLAHKSLEQHGVFIALVTDTFLAETKLTLNEVFGKSNYITIHILVNNKAGTVRSGVLNQHQYVLVYAKSKESLLERCAYDTSEGRQFCIEGEKCVSTAGPVQRNDDKSRPYVDSISPFRLVSNIRTQKRKENDNHCYPIYYVPREDYELNVQLDGYDWSPTLSTKPLGLPNEVILYPTTDSGKECIWNTLQSTFVNNHNNNSYCVKQQNGKYKLYVKIRDNISENGNVLIPSKTLLDIEGLSNLTTSKTIADLVGKKETFFGFSPNLVNHLLNLYTKSQDSVLAINDLNMSVYVGNSKTKSNRKIVSLVNPEVFDYTKLLSSLIVEEQEQFINMGLDKIDNQDVLEYLDVAKSMQIGLVALRAGILCDIVDNESYSIYETSNYDLIVCLKKRYDIETYQKINEIIDKEMSPYCTGVSINYIDDSSYCQGQNIIVPSKLISRTKFTNLLIEYRDYFMKHKKYLDYK